MLSNGVPEIVARIRADHDLASLFDAVVISYEVQLAKPEPEIYRVALDRLGVPAFDALFVDDRAENIDAARELGLQTLLFTGDVHALRAMTLMIDPRHTLIHNHEGTMTRRHDVQLGRLRTAGARRSRRCDESLEPFASSHAQRTRRETSVSWRICGIAQNTRTKPAHLT